MRRGPFFFFCFSLFKMTENSFGSTKMEIFHREKVFYEGEKKSGKMTLPPQKNVPVMPLLKRTSFVQLMRHCTLNQSWEYSVPCLQISADLPGKKRQGKNVKGVKWRKKRRKTVKGKVKLKMEGGKSYKMRRGLFFFGFLFFIFYFFLLFTFQNHYNLFWVYQNGNFLQGKSISRQEKIREKRLCPLRKIFLLRPWPCVHSYIMCTLKVD